jgi:hypothetical protein
MLLKIQAFWDMTLCCWVNGSEHFKVPSSSGFSDAERIAMSKSRVYYSGMVEKG